jgi:hypothetical protein
MKKDNDEERVPYLALRDRFISGDDPGGVEILAHLANERREREAREVGAQEQTRKRLLARMAGNIACGIESGATFEEASAAEVADRAVAIAEAILDRLAL